MIANHKRVAYSCIAYRAMHNLFRLGHMHNVRQIYSLLPAMLLTGILIAVLFLGFGVYFI